MKPAVITHIAISVVAGLFIWILGSAHSAESFLLGAAISFANFVALFWLMKRIFEKKQVALSSLIIVFKYLILGLIIYFIMSRTDVQIYWFGAGLVLLVVTLGVNNKSLQALAPAHTED